MSSSKRLSAPPNGAIAILASQGEAGDIARTLSEDGLSSVMLEPDQLPRALQQGRFAAAIIAAEMLPRLDLSRIRAIVENQSSWLNFQFILLLDRQQAPVLQGLRFSLGNVMLLERPLLPAFLVHCARTALHTYKRQLETEEQALRGEGVGERLRDATETLEKRVRQRMRELASANQRLRQDADELRRLQADLVHVSRLSAMGTMASTLAHELNQPLTALSSYLSGSRRLLSDPAASPDEARAALLAAETAALRAGQILRRLREFVSRGSVSVKPEKLDKLVAEACELGFVDQHLLGVSHRAELDSACGWVSADGVQVQQVLINLFRNAIQAMEDSPRKQVVIRSAPSPGDMVEISVSDTGGGLAGELREALFSPFQSTKLDGMGIGLSISRTIVEAHGGRIWAEDAAGGAIFRFTLPRAEAPDGSEGDALP